MFKRVAKSAAQKTTYLLFAILLCAGSASAQLELGENLKMNLNGTLGYGYNGSYGSEDSSTNHSQGVNGSADLRGFYFHPNFLSFNLHEYYDRTQSNSDSQVITRSTGIGGSVEFFGGSRFPGSISFGKDFSRDKQFQIADVPSIEGDSSGQNFNISWSALVPKLPTLAASYSLGSSNASIAGIEDSSSHASSRNFNLNSGYSILGFGLQGMFSHGSTEFTTPSFLTGESLSTSGSYTQYGLNAGHRLPLRGGMSLAWTHSTSDSGDQHNFSTNSYTASMSVAPWRKVSFYQTATYTTDIVAAFGQSILTGTGATFVISDRSSSGFFYTAGSTYMVGHGVNINGHLTHRIQTIFDRQFVDTQYGGSVNYNFRSRLLGFMYVGLGVVDTATKQGNQGAGLAANVGMSHKFFNWETAADFNYSQQVETLVGVSTTSNYSYGFSANRKINQDWHLGSSYRVSHSALVAQEGNGNASQTTSSYLSWKKYTGSFAYSQSSGTAVLNSSGGLTPTPVGSLITNDFMLFNARSVSFGGGTRLFRKVMVSAGYSKFTSDVKMGVRDIANTGERYSVRTDYRLRKFSIAGNFGHSAQTVSVIPGGPRVVNSFSINVSRWFNVF